MPFYTLFNKHILNIIFEYSDIYPQYFFYKQKKKSINAFRDIKLKYKCHNCNKLIKNPNKNNYGFIINYYKYYNIEYIYYPSQGITTFYHNKRRKFNSESQMYDFVYDINQLELNTDIQENFITENYYYITIRMSNILNNKVLGKLILKKLSHIEHSYDKMFREVQNLNKYGVNIKLSCSSKKNIIKDFKNSLLNSNLNELNLGYYCKHCNKKNEYTNFLKL